LRGRALERKCVQSRGIPLATCRRRGRAHRFTLAGCKFHVK